MFGVISCGKIVPERTAISLEIPHTYEWDGMTPEEKKCKLYEQQVELLENFRERRAISEEQYQKSCHDLTEKMGFAASDKSK